MSGPSDDMEMEKMAEDELAKLQRQFRVMEADRGAAAAGARPARRSQRSAARALAAELAGVALRLRLARGAADVAQSAKTREKLSTLLKDHEKYSSEVKEYRSNIGELDFLLKQVQKEIEKLRSKGTGLENVSDAFNDRTIIGQLENRLNTAMTKFNSVNSENYSVRLQIDRLLRDRQFFNRVWKGQVGRLMEGKAQILELVERAIGTYDQREEWSAKLDALKEKAAVDYRKHCLEVRELQRQLDHSMKLEEFLRTKGTVRLTAADAKAEAKRLERREMEMRTYNNHVNILDALKEYTGEDDVDRLMQEFTRREEENYALFNYINEVNTELKNLSDNVEALKANIAEEHAAHQARLSQQRDSAGALRAALTEARAARQRAGRSRAGTERAMEGLLGQIRKLAVSSQCDSLPLLKLLGQSLDVNVTNARLYIESLERKIVETVDVIKADEKLAEARARTPPARRRRRATPSPRPP